MVNKFIVLIMDVVDPNPYFPPMHEPETATPAIRWRVVPAAGSFVLGLVSFGFGILAVAVMTYVLLTQNTQEMIGGMLAGCILYLGFGAAWMIAGRLYWRSRYRKALVANSIGVMFPVVLFAIHGI